MMIERGTQRAIPSPLYRASHLVVELGSQLVTTDDGALHLALHMMIHLLVFFPVLPSLHAKGGGLQLLLEGPAG